MPIPALHRSAHSRLAARRDALALMGQDDYWSEFARNHPRLLTAIIPNGVVDPIAVAPIDNEARMNYRRQIGIPEDARHVVGTVGMLRADRKPAVYIPVFAEIARAVGRDVHFVMAGSGPQLEHLQVLIKQHGLEDRIHLPGLVLEPRLPLSIMDLYITSNVGPVTGLAAMEAAFAGLPLLAIQLQEKYQAKPDDWIWSSPDAAQVAARAVALLNSPGERETLARQQRDYVQAHHSIESMVRSYASLYDAAISRARPSATQLQHNVRR
jgi:glycosyltransferase involved in cell wall biosynthesis